MITKVILRNFKRFVKESFEFDSRVILAGPNNSGKTTVIQAIAAWRCALSAWLDSTRSERAIGLTRREFAPVPLREFNQLWTNKSTGFKRDEVAGKSQGTPRPLEIEIHGIFKGEKWSLPMEFKYSNKDQIYVKPKPGHEVSAGARELDVVHVPPFSGIDIDETEYNRAFQNIQIGLGKPGIILRNLLQDVAWLQEQNLTEDKWGQLSQQWRFFADHVYKLFGYIVYPPTMLGDAFIRCDYRVENPDGSLSPRLDINTAGSGFQQVLLLLAFLYARPATVFLIDEPDAHMHINLQGEVYRLLQKVAEERNSQLVIATHSELLLDSTEPRKIISFFGKSPHCLVDSKSDRDRVREALKRLDAMDLLRAEQSAGMVLFAEGQSDFDILREWAMILGHRLFDCFEKRDKGAFRIYCYDMKGKRTRAARDHFFALQAAFPKMKGFVLIDLDEDRETDRGFGSSNPELVLKKWNRRMIENYLIHPDAIDRLVDRFRLGEVENQTLLFGPDPNRAKKKLRDIMPPDFFKDPVNDPTGYLKSADAKEILASVFGAARLSIGKREYHRLAAVMKPEEIHPDVVEMLDAIADHFGIGEGEK